MQNRCEWAKDELSIKYHDDEWCKPQHDDQQLFEFLILEGAQAGLTWATILKRREGYRNAFSNFDVISVSNYNSSDMQKLLNDESIIRNKLKIKSAINNAKQFLKIKKEFGTFDQYIWAFVDFKQVKNHFKSHSNLPAYTILSQKISNDLKKRKFTFVGPTICYSLMQAIGMVNDHTSDCFLYEK